MGVQRGITLGTTTLQPASKLTVRFGGPDGPVKVLPEPTVQVGCAKAIGVKPRIRTKLQHHPSNLDRKLASNVERFIMRLVF